MMRSVNWSLFQDNTASGVFTPLTRHVADYEFVESSQWSYARDCVQYLRANHYLASQIRARGLPNGDATFGLFATRDTVTTYYYIVFCSEHLGVYR
jgi:hypothetical protein